MSSKPKVERVRAKWYENDPRTFVLQTQVESLNERDTAVLANCAKTGLDIIAITPILEPAAPELLALVANDVLRGGTGGLDGTF
jgi:hypothetical protein